MDVLIGVGITISFSIGIPLITLFSIANVPPVLKYLITRRYLRKSIFNLNNLPPKEKIESGAEKTFVAYRSTVDMVEVLKSPKNVKQTYTSIAKDVDWLVSSHQTDPYLVNKVQVLYEEFQSTVLLLHSLPEEDYKNKAVMKSFLNQADIFIASIRQVKDVMSGKAMSKLSVSNNFLQDKFALQPFRLKR